MLNKIKSILSRVKFILNSNKFKSIFLIIIFTCIFNLFNIPNGIRYEEALFSSMTSTLFLFVIIGILFISSCITLIFFDKEYSIILRFENKTEYLKNLLISITFINLILFILSIAITIMLVTFKYFGAITFGKLSSYNIPFAVYNIFTVIKYFIVIDILSLIGICIYKNFGKICCYIYYAIILILYYSYPVSANIVGNFDFKSLFFKYYIFPYQYTNFFLELTSTIIYICIMMLFIFLIAYATIRYNKIKIDE